MKTDRIHSLSMESPLGRISLTSDERSILAILMHSPMPSPMHSEDGRPAETAASAEAPQVLLEARRQLEEYFEGQRRTFSFPADAEGTEFQRKVWKALLDIPFAETESYGALAARIGSPGAARAVGAANGRNPIAIAIPCHRVIGAGGALTGYAGGEERKRWLLEHERRVKARSKRRSPG